MLFQQAHPKRCRKARALARPAGYVASPARIKDLPFVSGTPAQMTARDVRGSISRHRVNPATIDEQAIPESSGE